MSGYNNQSSSFDDDGYGQERQDGTTGGGLRKALEDALDKLEKTRQELEAYKRGDSVEQVLKDKGLDPAVKELIPADANPSEWIDKYSHLLGAKGTEREVKPAPSDESPEIVAPVEEDPALVAEREALAQIQGAADAGSQSALMGDVLERMNKIDSEEELMKFFGSNGALGG